MRTPLFLVAVSFAVILGSCAEHFGQQSAAGNRHSRNNNSDTVRINDTHGVPLLDTKLDSKANTVYAPAFRAAWTLLVNDILGEYVRTVDAVPLADMLNQSPFRPVDMQDWVLEAGNVSDGVIERIKQSLMYKFNETDPSLDKWRKEKDAIICYARMVKVMAFKYPFESLEWNFYHDDEAEKVACFGITKKRFNEDEDIAAMQQQVKIHDYRHPDDFIVSLATADPSMEIILAKVPPEEDLQKMVTIVNERMAQTVPEDFTNIDEIMIPKLRLHSDQIFSELVHQRLANKGFEKWIIAEARQEVDLILDESGALAQATGKVIKIKGPTSRVYAFDKPFLVLCRVKGSTEPEIAAWIANTSVMHKVVL